MVIVNDCPKSASCVDGETFTIVSFVTTGFTVALPLCGLFGTAVTPLSTITSTRSSGDCPAVFAVNVTVASVPGSVVVVPPRLKPQIDSIFPLVLSIGSETKFANIPPSAILVAVTRF